MDLPARCVDLSADHVRLALTSKEAMRALLEHMAKIARPGEGAPKILVPIARMASLACDWVDGGLTVELTSEGTRTRLVISLDLGGGFRELFFPRLSLGAPTKEFLRALDKAPKLIAPMKSRLRRDGLVLTCDEETVGTLPPPAFEVAEQSFRRSLPPKLLRSLPPVAKTPEPIELDALDGGWEASPGSARPQATPPVSRPAIARTSRRPGRPKGP